MLSAYDTYEPAVAKSYRAAHPAIKSGDSKAA
jgi:hypothetical protein